MFVKEYLCEYHYLKVILIFLIFFFMTTPASSIVIIQFLRPPADAFRNLEQQVLKTKLAERPNFFNNFKSIALFSLKNLQYGNSNWWILH